MKEPLLFTGRYKSKLDLARLLRDKDLRGVAVEVGVWRGDFSDPFMEAWAGDLTLLVDPWRKFPQEEYDDIRNTNFDPADYDFCRERFKKYGNRASLLRCTSEEAAQNIHDESLDFVYLDANHSYERVRQDIALWWPKVRWGGVLAGHDIFLTTHPGVTAAVCEFLTRTNLVGEIVEGHYNELGHQDDAHSWFVEKGQ